MNFTCPLAQMRFQGARTPVQMAYRWSVRRSSWRAMRCSASSRVFDRASLRRTAHMVQEEDEAEEGAEHLFQQQVVKLETIHAIPSFTRPWDTEEEVATVSSGFILDVERRLIMTTAGAVDFSRRLSVFRAGRPEGCSARLLASCPDCDAALITVDADEFWQGAEAVAWGKLPHLQAPVTAVGFSQGGAALCITSGVVSRVEVIEYAHSQRNLLGLQVDAPLNRGVWGGPVFDARGRLLGMALQKRSSQSWWERYDEDMGQSRYGDDGDEEPGGGGGGGDGEQGDEEGGAEGDEDDDEDGGAENVGYVAPVVVLQHFLRQQQRAEQAGGPLAGFPALGAQLVPLDSEVLRRSLGLQERRGVLVRRVFPMSGAVGLLQPDDVLLEIDGVPIACDGSVALRPGQRTSHSYLLSRKQVGARAALLVLRAGQQLRLELHLTRPRYLVPPSLEGCAPPYLIFAGLLFLSLSVPLLMELPPRPQPPHDRQLLALLGLLEDAQPQGPADEVVVVCGTLVCDAIDEYTDLIGQHPKQVLSVNGAAVASVKHLARLLLGCREPFVRLELGSGQVVVLENKGLRRQTEQVLRRNGIKYAMSRALRSELKTSWPATAGAGAGLRLQRSGARGRG